MIGTIGGATVVGPILHGHAQPRELAPAYGHGRRDREPGGDHRTAGPEGVLILPAAPPFAKVLVANRGEIAVRIIRACRELGIRSVAVFSEADRDALHVRHADEAVSHRARRRRRESYLNGTASSTRARDAAREAIHPGYGFLSENAGVRARVRRGGRRVHRAAGPRRSRRWATRRPRAAAMQAAGVPIVPGTTETLTDDAGRGRREGDRPARDA